MKPKQPKIEDPKPNEVSGKVNCYRYSDDWVMDEILHSQALFDKKLKELLKDLDNK